MEEQPRRGKYEHMYVVIRSNAEIENPEYVIALTKAYAKLSDAEREVARMNELKSGTRSRYFVGIARVVPSEEDGERTAD